VKYYHFGLHTMDVENMWDFAMKHEMNVHFVKTVFPPDDQDPITKFRKTIYIYKAFMTSETYLMFKIVVPGVLECKGYA
jgi:hypothetical protein